MFSDPTSSDAQHGRDDGPLLGRTAASALRGDGRALAELLSRHRARIRRIVSVRLAARLAQILDAEPAEEAWREVLRGSWADEAVSEAALVRMLASLVEGEVRRRTEGVPGETRGPRRTLRFDAAPDARRLRREDLERVIDARVAALEAEEQREVVLLRDYCGAGWRLVRARLGLLSIEEAQELYRRAHERLATSLRSGPQRD